MVRFVLIDIKSIKAATFVSANE